MAKKNISDNQAWEQHYRANPPMRDKKVIGKEFDPMKASERMKPYVKVNREDH